MPCGSRNMTSSKPRNEARWLAFRLEPKRVRVSGRCAIVGFCLFALSATADGQLTSEISTDQGAYQIAVDVNLVVLHPVVRDRTGSFVSDLGQQNFTVYEDGVPQTIKLFRHEDTPVTVGLVVDHSGSMRSKLDNVIAAATAFAQSSNAEDELFVVNFNENVSLGLAEGTLFTNDRDKLERAISHVPAAGMTALYDAAVAGLKRLRIGSRSKKVLLLVSDGGDTASEHTLAQVLTMAQQSNAIIYTIGLFDEEDPDKNPKVLRRLARETGGASFLPETLDEIVEVCENIALEIRNQYTIGYFSSNTADDSGYRSIRVAARTPERAKLAVRSRAGYLPGGESQPDASVGAK